MTAFALLMLMFFHCSVCNEIQGLGLSTSNKTQIVCAQLRASPCSHAIRWDLRCAPVGLRVTSKSKGYRSIKAGKVKITVKRHVIRLSWDAALLVCQSEGGSLVKIDTKEKETAIIEKMKIKRKFDNRAFHWMGLRYFKESSRPLWTDKSPLRYENWGHGEPSHTHKKMYGTIVKEGCVALAVHAVYGTYWNDRHCYKKCGFICEVL